MILDFILGAFLNIQHQVSSIPAIAGSTLRADQHRPRKSNGFAPPALK
jgi:hypothetical protein